ncbi:MAG: hypothetical protein ABSD38_00315 [Syntrophorhabdales bacterium]|jgi:hypothetical protein
MKKQLIGLIVLVLFFCPAFTLYAQTDMGYPVGSEREPASGEAMVADVLIVRPISFVALVLGTGIAIVATPFALASGTTRDVYGRLVEDPFDHMVLRPLGEGW